MRTNRTKYFGIWRVEFGVDGRNAWSARRTLCHFVTSPNRSPYPLSALPTSPCTANGVNLRKKQRSYLLLCHLELVERSLIYQSYGIKRFFTSFRMFDKAP